MILGIFINSKNKTFNKCTIKEWNGEWAYLKNNLAVYNILAAPRDMRV